MFHKSNKSPAEKSFLVNIINQKTSMGNWEEHLTKLQNVMKDEKMPSLYFLIKNTKTFVNSCNAVNWRNKNVGHSALPLLNDDTLYDDLFKRIEGLTKFLNNQSEVYEKIQIYIYLIGMILQGTIVLKKSMGI